jgi:hypothetical protein
MAYVQGDFRRGRGSRAGGRPLIKGDASVTAFKWTGILIAVVTTALAALANLLVATLTVHTVPAPINEFALALIVVGTMVAFIAYLQERSDRRVDAFIGFVRGRLDDLESRIGDHNTGFVEGYLLGHGDAPEAPAPVVPLAPRGVPRRAANSSDD